MARQRGHMRSPSQETIAWSFHVRTRWEKINPGGNLEYFVGSFSVEPLPDANFESLTASEIGPYNAEPSVRV